MHDQIFIRLLTFDVSINSKKYKNIFDSSNMFGMRSMNMQHTSPLESGHCRYCFCFCFCCLISLFFYFYPAVSAAAAAAGMQKVIAGMDRGVEGMRVGGSREIAIPAALG